jgi:PhnB protein
MKVTNLIPMLAFQDAGTAIEFYKKAFDAVEVLRMEDNGKITHAEIKIGTTEIMIADNRCSKSSIRRCLSDYSHAGNRRCRRGF